jgi:hypothetical protein
MTKLYLTIFALFAVSSIHSMKRYKPIHAYKPVKVTFINEWKKFYFDSLDDQGKNGLRELITHFDGTRATAHSYFNEKPSQAVTELSKMTAEHMVMTQKYLNNPPVITGYTALLQQMEGKLVSRSELEKYFHATHMLRYAIEILDQSTEELTRKEIIYMQGFQNIQGFYESKTN